MTPPSAAGRFAAALALLATGLLSQATELSVATTEPVGFHTLAVPGSAATGTQISLRSLGLTRPAEYVGQSEAMTATTLADAQATWGEGAFNAAAGKPRYYLEIVRPAGVTSAVPGEGTTYDILASTGLVATAGTPRTLTLQQPLSAEVLAAGPHLAFKVRAHWTLAGALGGANELGLLAGTATTADLVQIFNTSIQQFESYYYGLGDQAGWRNAATGAPADDQVIYPEDGMVIRRKGVGARQIALLGAPKLGNSSVSIQPGTNLVAQPYAEAMALNNSGLLQSGFAKNEGGGGDEVSLHDGTKYVAYYYRSGGMGPEGWVNAATRLVENPVIPPGTAMLIRRRGTVGFTWQLTGQVAAL